MYPVVEIFLPGVQKRFPDKLPVIVELGFRYGLVLLTCKYEDGIFFRNKNKTEKFGDECL